MHRRDLLLLFTLSLFTFFVTATDSMAVDHVVMVEEDWEMQVGEPNSARSAPQATMMMSPGNDDGDYFILAVNHKTAPEYEAGGLQVQVWSGENAVSFHNGPQGGCLNQSNDNVRWTQRMKVKDGFLSFEIDNGASQSWGSFGGQGYLKAATGTSLPNLNAYRPYVSLSESGIGFAGNRVASLKLVRTRWYLDDGKVYELPGNANIDADLDPWTSSEATSDSWEVSDL